VYTNILNDSVSNQFLLLLENRLMELFGFESLDVLTETHGQWIEESLKKDKLAREERWSRSIAVGSREYIENRQTKLGVKAIHLKIHESKGSFEIREDQIPYTADFGPENERLRQENTYKWNPF